MLHVSISWIWDGLDGRPPERARPYHITTPRIAERGFRFLPYSELEAHREAMARFGQGVKAIDAVARSLSPEGALVADDDLSF